MRPFTLPVKPENSAFRTNLPALDLFPTTLWAQLTGRRLRSATTRDLLGCEAQGYLPLRQAIADYAHTSRGIQCAPEQVIVVSGVQEGLDLAARLLLNPGDKVLMEDPGYQGAYAVFGAIGARIVSMRLDEEGAAPREADFRSCRFVYVTPGHQYPVGMTMSLQRRLQLLAWAKKYGTPIFEDDYDSEFRFSGRPLPAMQGLDHGGKVIFCGSFNKVMFPSLRLGYLVVPRNLVDVFACTKAMTTRHQSLLDQAVLCDFIEQGHLGRHLRRMRKIYLERYTILRESAQQHLGEYLEIATIEAGLQTIGASARQPGRPGHHCRDGRAARRVGGSSTSFRLAATATRPPFPRRCRLDLPRCMRRKFIAASRSWPASLTGSKRSDDRQPAPRRLAGILV